AAAYEGSAIGALTEIGCGMGMDNTTPATTPVPVQAGHTYYFEAGGTNGPGPIVWYSFNLRQHVPANDLFAYSAVVPDLPYSDAGVVSSQATIEGFEGLPNCRYGGAAGSTWYRWTATASTSMKVTVTPTALAGNHLTPLVSIWTGASLATLAQVGGACNQAADFGQPAQVVTAVASGTTYYVQVIGANYSGPVMGYSLAIEDADAPRISGTPSAAFASPAGMKATAAPVKVTWAASVGNQLTPIDHYLWEQRLGLAAWSAPQSTKSTSVTRSLVAGSAYTLRVRAVDSVGRLSAWVAIALRPVAYQESSGKVAWKGTWSRAAGSVYSGGADRYASSKGASATFTFTGLGVALVTRTCPACGSASILVDGKALGTVNLKSATTGYRRIVVQTGWLVSGVHTLRVVVLATAGHPRVDIDAFLILH
ncbi:MAG: fibronectin type III domain-containing protein, partial [Chloroflexota bacterium]